MKGFKLILFFRGGVFGVGVENSFNHFRSLRPQKTKALLLPEQALVFFGVVLTRCRAWPYRRMTLDPRPSRIPTYKAPGRSTHAGFSPTRQTLLFESAYTKQSRNVVSEVFGESRMKGELRQYQVIR